MIIWQINPLPDFLEDHTLQGDSIHQRMAAVVSRWVQWIGGLSGWNDRASFCLRFVGDQGTIRVFLLANPVHDNDHVALSAELGIMLRVHRLGHGIPLNQEGTKQASLLWQKSSESIVEVRQYSTTSLWTPRKAFLKQSGQQKLLARVPERHQLNPPVVFPWWSPSGPFLLPMESLISQPSSVVMSVYLAPTNLTSFEWDWLALMASEAQSKSEQNLQQIGANASVRSVDPSSNLAGRLYIANLRRLTTNPFLVTVHCSCHEESSSSARSLAGAIQAVLHETPLDRPDQDDSRLPSAAEVMDRPDDGTQRLGQIEQFSTLHFSRAASDDALHRLPYLMDARGAAAVFRLPVSMNGGVPGLTVRQVSPDFHPGPRKRILPPRHIELGQYEVGGKAFMPVDDLCKHALVTGFTGSGKTVTVLQLLHQLWIDHKVPFLVLESAKHEYRGLFGVNGFQDSLRVYTLGNELLVPFRLNPFELLPGVRVEAHVSKIQTCIEAAIPPIGPSASIIAKGLVRVYERFGWSLTDVVPAQKETRRAFPRLGDFVEVVETVLEERGYDGEVYSNLKAALVGRFKPLLIGGKGRMFDCERSFPDASTLFEMPTILELNDLNLEDKALVVMFVLTLLREYRELAGSSSGRLRHVTMVEEAHNVLEDVGSTGGQDTATSADTRFKAVEAFCQMLTEVRALGEGLIIADQSPEKLARDAVRNTNLQIAHQLRDSNDRDAIARAMIMEKEQRDFLGKLRPGQAALFRTGLEKATFVRVSQYYGGETSGRSAPRGIGFHQDMSDRMLEKAMLRLESEWMAKRRPILPYQGCEFCRDQCQHRDVVYPETHTSKTIEAANEWFDCFEGDPSVSSSELWRNMAAVISDAGYRSGFKELQNDHSWCFLVHLWEIRYGGDRPERLQLDSEIYDRCCTACTTDSNLASDFPDD